MDMTGKMMQRAVVFVALITILFTIPGSGALKASDLLSDTASSILPTPRLLTMSEDDPDGNGDDDHANGTILDPGGDVMNGTLTWSNVPSEIDAMDWFKVNFTDIDPRPSSVKGVRNITLTMNIYNATQGELFEFGVDYSDPHDPKLKHDYADYLNLMIMTGDEFFGRLERGGTDWYYDNGNDSDGDTYDENWTFSFNAVNPSRGGPDTDGNLFGLTEVNWYYIGIGLNYYIGVSSPATRSKYVVHYNITMNTSKKQNNDPGASDIGNATEIPQTGSGVTGGLDSSYNPVDWYSLKGKDNSKIWGITVSISRKYYNIGGSPTTSMFWDNFMYVLIVKRDKGPDSTWNTSDDGWNVSKFRLSAIWDPNDKLDLYLIDIDVNSSFRELYIGLYIEPTEFTYASSQITGRNIAHWRAFSDYTITRQINEQKPSTAPIIKSITIESDLEGVDDGGHFDTEFTIYVEYMDVDGHRPEKVLLSFDKGTPYENEVDITDHPKDVFDNDVTDGKRFKFEFQGKNLGDHPYPHTLHAFVSELIPDGELDSPGSSGWFEYEAGLYVWDDYPVSLNEDWYGIPTIDEDSAPIGVELDAFTPPFLDAENDIKGYLLAPAGSENWTTSISTRIADISVMGGNSARYLYIEPRENMHGTESFQLKAYDDHSYAVRNPALRILPVNDPPFVHSVRIDGVDHPVDNTDPLRPVIHFEDEVEVFEDEEFSFRVIAEDSDPEGERSALDFSYEPNLSDPWDEAPEVEYNTGLVTIFPTNDDVKEGNGKITVTIDDHGEKGEIYLQVYLDIIDVNDPPNIMIPTTTARTWNQFSRMSIRPIAFDEDKNDHVTFSVNFYEALGTEYGSIMDQLPYMKVIRGIDWDINPATGEFFFHLVDQNIWRTATGMVQSVEITVVFQAMDKAGEASTASINLILNNENEEPRKPDRIYIYPDEPHVGHRVSFRVDPVFDPDGDALVYKWDFGDGSTGTGQHVNHTYSTHGWKTVQMWVEDGQFQTDKISIRVEVLEGPYDPWYDEDNDGDGVKNGQDDFVNDISASRDTDGDGHPDEWNLGYNHIDSTTGLTLDRFPYDPKEWQDSDGDGHGDNGDEFPYDPSEWKDTDGDGIGDNADIYPRVRNDNLIWYIIAASILLIFVIAVLLLVLGKTIKGGRLEDFEE